MVITSKNPPVQITAKYRNTIASINFNPGDSIIEGDILAILENPANEKDIAYLKEKLYTFLPTILSIEVLKIQFPGQLNLGTTIQPFYNKFLDAYQKLIMDRALGEGEILQAQLNQQWLTQNRTLQNRQQDILLAEQGLDLHQINLHRYQKLFAKGVISEKELERVQNEYLIEKRQYHFLEQQLNQLLLDKKGIEKNQQLAKNTEYQNITIKEADLLLALQDLKNKILEWEESYFLTSPISGRLSYNDIWVKHQMVEREEVVFTVVPFDRENIIGKCKIPTKNSGKIRVGQNVFVKLENFPYREWGTVKATVEFISELSLTSKEPGYVVYLCIDELTTSYGKKLEFNQELIGTAEILMEEVTVIERIFYQFRHLWSNNLKW